MNLCFFHVDQSNAAQVKSSVCPFAVPWVNCSKQSTSLGFIFQIQDIVKGVVWSNKVWGSYLKRDPRWKPG